MKVLSLDVLLGPGTSRRCLVEFLNPTDHISVGDEIEISDILSRKDAMIKMNSRWGEFASLTNPYGHQLGLAEIVVVYPAALGRFERRNDNENGDVAEANAEVIDMANEGGVRRICIVCNSLPPKGKLHCRIMPRD